MTRLALAAACFAAVAVATADYVEGFENIGGPTTNLQTAGANLEAGGWFVQNNSIIRGTNDWLQGLMSIFQPHSGVGYIAANFNNVLGYGGCSNWMLTPTTVLKNNSTLSFWTRAIAGSPFPDRLDVYLSTNGASTVCGTTAATADVGDFTVLLASVNFNLVVGGYPTVWTKYTVTYTGPQTSGRFGFRYFMKAAGPLGFNSDYIGIDDVQYTIGP